MRNHTDATTFIQNSPGNDDDYYDEEVDEEEKGKIDYNELYRKSLVLHSRQSKRDSDNPIQGRILKASKDDNFDIEATDLTEGKISKTSA